MKTAKLNRLIQLKMEIVQSLRQDMQQLDQLVNDSKSKLEQMVMHEDSFRQQIQHHESSKVNLSVGKMIEHRNFLTYLHEQSNEAKQSLSDVETQKQHAQYVLKQAYTEVKAFEMIAARLTKAELQQDTRRQFSAADDEQSIRFRYQE